MSDAINDIPQAKHKGGMTVRYQTNDNNYIQYMYIGTSTDAADFTNVDNWEKVILENEINEITSNLFSVKED